MHTYEFDCYRNRSIWRQCREFNVSVLPPKYLLLETGSDGYHQRTKLKVRDGDATLVFNLGAPDGGTLQTVRFAQALNSHHCVVQLDEGDLQALKPRTVAICAFVRNVSESVPITVTNAPESSPVRRSSSSNSTPALAFVFVENFAIDIPMAVPFCWRSKYRHP